MKRIVRTISEVFYYTYIERTPGLLQQIFDLAHDKRVLRYAKLPLQPVIKKYLFFCLVLLGSAKGFSQTVITVKASGGTYNSIAAAINFINSSALPAGGFRVDIDAGFSETFVNGTNGVSNGGITLSLTGTSGNPIIFQKSGSGTNPKITAGVGGGTGDYVIRLGGADYVTFDGIDIVNGSTTTNGYIEYAYYIVNGSSTNGTQYNTIKNCSVTLNKLDGNPCYGVYQFAANGATGTNSYNTYSNITVLNATGGIILSGNQGASSAISHDLNCVVQNCVIGPSVSGTNDMGGSLTGGVSCFGIFLNNQTNVTISNNTIQNINSTGAGGVYGIFYNGNPTSAGASTFTGNSVVALKNASTSFKVYGLYTSGNRQSLTISNNTIGPFYSGTNYFNTPELYGIYSLGVSSGLTSVYNNIVTNIGGNQFANNITAGIYINGALSNATSIYNNQVQNITQSVSGTNTLYGIAYVGGASSSIYGANIYNNTISNIDGNTVCPTAYGVYFVGQALSSAATSSIYGNTVNNVTAKANNNSVTDGMSITGANLNSISLYDCTIQNINGGGNDVFGLAFSGGSNSNSSIYRNKIYNVTNSFANAASRAWGMQVTGAASSTTMNVYNNFISSILRTYNNSNSSMLLAGLYVKANNNFNANLYYNSVWLTGNIYGLASAAYIEGTALALKNINNIYKYSGTQMDVSKYAYCIYYSTTGGLSNTSTEDYNIYDMSGGSSSPYFTGHDGSTDKTNLADWQTGVSPKDANSKNTVVTFISTTDLHLNTSLNDVGFDATNTLSITDDIDQDPRGTGAPGSGTSPTIGADELNRTGNTISAAQQICNGTVPEQLTGSINATCTGSVYSWESSTTSATTGFSTISGAVSANYTPPALTQTTWYRRTLSGTCNSTSVAVKITVDQKPVIANKTVSTCSGTAFSVTPTGIPAGTTYTWTAPTGTGFTGGSAQATPQTSISQTLTNTTANTVTAVYSVTPVSGACTGNSFTVTVTVDKAPGISNQTSITCSGTAFNVSPSGVVPTGTTYTWTAPTGTGFTGGSAQPTPQTSISQTLTNTAAGSVTALYTVTPISGTCTGAPFTLTVTIDKKPVIANQTVATCSGTAFTISPSGVPAGTTYTWTFPSGTGFTGGSAQPAPQTAISQTLTNTTTQAVTAVYTVTPKSGNCAGSDFTITVTLDPVPTLAEVSALPICSGTAGTVNLSGLLPGSINNSISYSINGVVQTPVTGINADGSGKAGFSIPVLTTANDGQILQVNGITHGSCTQPFAMNVTLAINSSGTWLGVNTDWQDTQNWCGGVPSGITNVLIPSGLVHYPDLNTGIGTANNITIQNGASVIVDNAILQLYGAVSNSGNLDVTSGTVELDGTLGQSIAGSMFAGKTIKNLTIGNSGASVAATAFDTLKISGTLAFGNINNANFSTGDNITLLSSSASTARVADVTNGGVNSGNNISGKVIVERYIPAHRAWRLLTVPFVDSDTLSINSAWQESVVDATLADADPVNPSPGYGIHITGGTTRNAPNVGNTGNNGFDAGPNSASIFSYSSTAWSVLPLSTHVPVKSQAAWMLFVRGNRSTDLRYGIVAFSSPAILRPKGNLKTGDTTIHLSTTGFQVIGNPYASTINYYDIFHNAANATAKLSSYYYAWDPLVTGSNGVGAFITYFPDPNTPYKYIPIPNPADHTIDIDGSIQSSQGFMVYDTASDVVIKETNKTSTNDHFVFGRPAGNGSVVAQLRTNLYAVNSDGTVSLSDGTLNLFNESYTNTVSLLDDAKKIGQFAENLGLSREGQVLSVEKRSLINGDTIFYNLGRMKQKSYKLEFIAENLYRPNLIAFLEDSYTATRKPVNLQGTTVINITVDGNAVSSAANRFRIVFETISGTLPVTYSSIKAWQQNHDIAVEWKVENEWNIKQYEIEKSIDGRNFVKITTIMPGGNGSSGIDYNWIDTDPNAGINYYRIRSIDNNGIFKYSQVVWIKMNKVAADISVYPNPVKDNIIGLQLNNMPEGVYQVRLLNAVGQVLQTSKINHIGGSCAQTITLKKSIAKGIYQLEVTHPGKGKTSIKLVNQ